MEDRIDIPQSFFERLFADKRKLAAAIGALVVLLALVAGLVYARAVSLNDERIPGTVVDNGDPVPDRSTDETTTSPAEETETVPGDGGAPSVEPTQSGSGSTPAPATPAVRRAPFIVYRLDSALYVAREDGTQARKVTASASGAFTLSPDGKTLAYVDGTKARLLLTDVGTGQSKDTGQALNYAPAWSPDSARLAYVAGAGTAPEIRLTSRAGSAQGTVVAGHSPVFGNDGAMLLVVAGAAVGQPGEVTIAYVGGRSAGAIAGGGRQAADATFGVDGVVAALSDGSGGTSRLLTAPAWRPGTTAAWSEIPVHSSAGETTAIARLCASPDGKYLAYAESGDDGYSRAFVYDVARRTSVALSVRRDTYPLCWTSDGSRVLFVEGNAFQGEPTALMSVQPDGMGRRVLVDGAGL
ncbi:MAG: hypothetical protein ACYC6C_05170 [Coriobacteriia bacterium]